MTPRDGELSTENPLWAWSAASGKWIPKDAHLLHSPQPVAVGASPPPPAATGTVTTDGRAGQAEAYVDKYVDRTTIQTILTKVPTIGLFFFLLGFMAQGWLEAERNLNVYSSVLDVDDDETPGVDVAETIIVTPPTETPVEVEVDCTDLTADQATDAAVVDACADAGFGSTTEPADDFLPGDG